MRGQHAGLPRFRDRRWSVIARTGLMFLLALVAPVLAPLAVGAATPTNTLGPSPQNLPQSWVAGFHLSGHIFHPGDRITGTITVKAQQCLGSNGGPCYRGTNWGVAGATCPPTALTCTWVAGDAAPNPTWQVLAMPIGNTIGPADSDDYYAIIDSNTYALDGSVTDLLGNPLPGITIAVDGPENRRVTTDSNGYYNLLLHMGTYHVAPQTDGLDGTISFAPGNASVTLSSRARHAQASFVLDPCGAGRGTLAPPGGARAAHQLSMLQRTTASDGTSERAALQGSARRTSTDVSCASTFDYEMPDRFGPENAARLIDYPAGGLSDSSSGAITVAPSSWPVTFSVHPQGLRACSTHLTYEWTVVNIANVAHTPNLQDRGAFTPDPHNPCQYTHSFPAEGTYKVTIVSKKPIKPGLSAVSGEVTKTVVVQDWLIVGLGDSVASGEGNPDLFGAHPTWESARCDRSADSFEAQTALKVEAADPQTSVTFVHLACSGAGIARGVTGPYFGEQAGNAGLPLSSQISAMSGLIGSRKVDALLISIGANDIGFGDIVGFCGTKNYGFNGSPAAALNPLTAAPTTTPCFTDRFPTKTSPTTLDRVVRQKLAALPGLYDQMARRLQQAGVAPSRVYITQYYDPTTDARGQPCPHMDFTVPKGAANIHLPGLNATEARWAETSVVHALNAAVQAAAAAHGWHYVSGIQNGFIGHGYCTAPGISYVRTMAQSFHLEGAPDGTMHPNVRGHAFIASLLAPMLLHDLYLDHNPRGGHPRAH